jgi:hypothetical protein
VLIVVVTGNLTCKFGMVGNIEFVVVFGSGLAIVGLLFLSHGCSTL